MSYRVLSLMAASGLFAACSTGPVGPAENTDDEVLGADLSPTLMEGMDVLAMDSGSFYMGSDEMDIDRNTDESLHLVDISNGFEMGTTEITREQFVEYMGYDPVDLWAPDDEAILNCWDCPIQSVTWHEAAAFANALSESNGLESCFDCTGADADVFCTSAKDPYACDGYRMPTEAEWEYSARADDETTYSGSEDIESVGWYRENSNYQVHPVASMAPNGWGLFDMSGNIREMVYDWYNPWFPEQVVDPISLPGEGVRPVERGGSYACVPHQLRVNTRYQYSGYERDTHVGFRIARTLR